MSERESWSIQSSLVSDDGVYSINWNEFCFEKELHARKIADEIYMEGLQSFNDIIIEKLRGLPYIPRESDIGIHDRNKLQRENKEAAILAQQMIEKYRILNIENKQLKTQKTKLKQATEKNKEALAKEEEEYRKNNKAYNKALPKYCTNFDLNITCTVKSESTFEALVKFKSKPEMKPIKLLIDKAKRKILEFDASEIFTTEDSMDLAKVIEPKNVPLLLCRVRDHVLN